MGFTTKELEIVNKISKLSKSYEKAKKKTKTREIALFTTQRESEAIERAMDVLRADLIKAMVEYERIEEPRVKAMVASHYELRQDE